MKPLSLFLALASLLASRSASADPKCTPGVTGGVSTNWGQDYREHVLEIFQQSKAAAGVTQTVLLINVNDLNNGKNGGTRTVDGSPISALPKGTQGLTSDAIIYTFGVFEIACDEAQLATFMLHEMRHLKVVNGKNHFDQVQACRKAMVNEWASSTDLSVYPDDKSAIAAFNKAKGGEVQTKCILPVENEADQFAFDNLSKLPYKTGEGADPNRDARAQAFKNAEAWAVAIGDNPCDGGHGCLGARGDKGAAVAKAQLEQNRQAQERIQGMSIQPGTNGF